MATNSSEIRVNDHVLAEEEKKDNLVKDSSSISNTGLHSSNINDTTIYPLSNNNMTKVETNTIDNNIKENINKEKDNVNTEENINNVLNKNECLDDEDHENHKHNLKMEILICNAFRTFKQFINPESSKENKIPQEILKEAKGILFLSITKGGIGVSGIVGNGIMMGKTKANNQWSGPCAVSIQGVQIGLNVGYKTVDHILILRDDMIMKMITHNKQLRLGNDISITVGPFDGDLAKNENNNNNKSVYSYSISRGIYVGLSLEGQIVYVNDDYNKEFYCSAVDPTSILNGNIQFRNNVEYYALCNILDKYTQNNYQSIDELCNKQQFYA